MWCASKKAIFESMERTGLEKAQAGTFALAIQNSPASVAIAEDAVISESYLVPQPPKPDKKQLLADLKSGVLVESDKIQIVQGRHLRIK